MRILTVEDDPSIRRGILHSLRFNGFDVAEAGDGTTGLELAQKLDYDLLLLDLVLPGVEGLEILRAVRRQSSHVPVIILTARGDEEDRVRGLELGADDYVVKPFSVRELLARIEAVLRRSPSRPAEPLQLPIPGGVLDLGQRALLFEGEEPSPLSEREATLLAYLVRHAGRAVSRDELLARVWHLNPEAISTRTVDMHIVRLREKLRDAARISTVWGRGYRFEVP